MDAVAHFVREHGVLLDSRHRVRNYSRCRRDRSAIVVQSAALVVGKDALLDGPLVTPAG